MRPSPLRHPLAVLRTTIGLHQGDLAGAPKLLEFCTKRKRTPETPLVLEALIKGYLRALTGAAGPALLARWPGPG